MSIQHFNLVEKMMKKSQPEEIPPDHHVRFHIDGGFIDVTIDTRGRLRIMGSTGIIITPDVSNVVFITLD